MRFLGIDTSNYTTSAALYDDGAGTACQVKRPLSVKEGQLGLRQSDAVFAHVKTLGGVLEELFSSAGSSLAQGESYINGGEVAAIGVSVRPRNTEGSYMPCFLCGEMAARVIGAAKGIEVYGFSHQHGHIAAALFGARRMDLFRSPFLAFHISGGTTECVAVEPGPDSVFQIKLAARSLDLHAGQVIDRVGGMLGLPFPAGPELERLAEGSAARFQPRVSMKGCDCSLSGLENQCARKLAEGAPPPDVARYCLDYLAVALERMARAIMREYPGRELVFAGGVMANRIIREYIQARFDPVFSPPEYSADNGAGAAILAACAHTSRSAAKQGD